MTTDTNSTMHHESETGNKERCLKQTLLGPAPTVSLNESPVIVKWQKNDKDQR